MSFTQTQAENFLTSAYQAVFQRNPGALHPYLDTQINGLVSGSWTPDGVLQWLLASGEYTKSLADQTAWSQEGGESSFLSHLSSQDIWTRPTVTTVTPTPTPKPPTTTTYVVPPNYNATSVKSDSVPYIDTTGHSGGNMASSVQAQANNSQGAFSSFSFNSLPSLAVGGFSSNEVWLALGAAAIALFIFGRGR